MLYSEPGQLESTAQYPAFEPDAQRGGKGQGTLEVERFFGELVQREQRAQEEGLAQREREQQDEQHYDHGVETSRNGNPVETLSSAPLHLPHEPSSYHDSYMYPPASLVKPLLNLDLSANMLQQNQYHPNLPDAVAFASTIEFNPLLGTSSRVGRVRAAHQLIPRRQRSTSEGDIFGYAAQQNNAFLPPKPALNNHGGMIISPAGYGAAEVLGFGYRPPADETNHSAFPIRSQIPTPISQPSYQHFRPQYYSQHAQSNSTIPQPLPSTSTLIPATSNSTSSNWLGLDSSTDAPAQFYSEPEEHDLSPEGVENYTPRAERETSTADAEGEEDDDDVYSMRNGGGVQSNEGGNRGLTPAAMLASATASPSIVPTHSPHPLTELAYPAHRFDNDPRNVHSPPGKSLFQSAPTPDYQLSRSKRPREEGSPADHPRDVDTSFPAHLASTTPLISPPLVYHPTASGSSTPPEAKGKASEKPRVRGRPREAPGATMLSDEVKLAANGSSESKTTSATLKASEKRRKAGVVARFVCELCGESFTRKYNLKGHLNAHLNKKPFACVEPGCKKAFARRHDLTRHVLLHTKSGNLVPLTTRKKATSKAKNAGSSELDAEGEDWDGDAGASGSGSGRKRVKMEGKEEDEYEDEDELT